MDLGFFARHAWSEASPSYPSTEGRATTVCEPICDLEAFLLQQELRANEQRLLEGIIARRVHESSEAARWLDQGQVGSMGPKEPPEPPSQKLCRRCNKHKPLDHFYRSKASTDGHDARCKKCDAVHCKKRREQTPRVQMPTVESKLCRRCGLHKLAKDFHRYTTNLDGLHNFCKSCFRQSAEQRNQRGQCLKASSSSESEPLLSELTEALWPF